VNVTVRRSVRLIVLGGFPFVGRDGYMATPAQENHRVINLGRDQNVRFKNNKIS